MPLNITIDINGHPVRRFRIGRTERLTGPFGVHRYKVIETSPDIDPESILHDWSNAVIFTHRYSDGAEVCAEKALSAWREAGEPDGSD